MDSIQQSISLRTSPSNNQTLPFTTQTQIPSPPPLLPDNTSPSNNTPNPTQRTAVTRHYKTGPLLHIRNPNPHPPNQDLQVGMQSNILLWHPPVLLLTYLPYISLWDRCTTPYLPYLTYLAYHTVSFLPHLGYRILVIVSWLSYLSIYAVS